eukprot:7378044-Prymnesium_polylepis.1
MRSQACGLRLCLAHGLGSRSGLGQRPESAAPGACGAGPGRLPRFLDMLNELTSNRNTEFQARGRGIWAAPRPDVLWGTRCS